jgi:hypothetical protein
MVARQASVPDLHSRNDASGRDNAGSPGRPGVTPTQVFVAPAYVRSSASNSRIAAE